MGHSYKVEIWNDSAGTASIIMADGDDVTVTSHISLAAEPDVVLERNTSCRAIVQINNVYEVAAWNIMSSSCTLWSDGVARAVAEGMFIRIYQRDEVSGADVRTFQGRILKKETDNAGVVTLTSYDELMVLGEFADPFVVFDKARDRIGDVTLANGPNITVAFNSSNQLTATLPDIGIVSPLMRLALAEPDSMTDESYVPESDDMDSGDRALSTHGLSIYRRITNPNFFKLKFRYCNAGSAAVNVTAAIYTATTAGYPNALVASVSVSLPVTGASTFVDYESSCFPTKLTKDGLYCFVLLYDEEAIQIPIKYNTLVTTCYYNGSAWYNIGSYSPYIVPVGLTEREIGSDDYLLSEGTSTTSIVVDYGDTNISNADVSGYGRFLRVSYFYGTKAVSDVMIALAQRAGLGASRAGSLGAGDVKLGYYNTATYSYLECMQELANLWETANNRQWVFGCDMSGSLGTKVLKIGARYKPWVDSIGGYTFSDDPLTAEVTGSVYKRISEKSLKQAFEAKVGTVRVIGEAADGSPISCQIDDRLWSDSLVTRTGSPMMEYVVDNTIATHSLLVQIAEAYIREQHQNAVEGTISLNGLWPNLWVRDTSSNYFGQAKVDGLSIPSHALSAATVMPRRIELKDGKTTIELDNERLNDVTMVRRSVDKTKRNETFDVESLPDTVYIYVRYTGTLPSSYASYDRMKVIKTNNEYYLTSDIGTRLVFSNDYCSPTSGAGYAHVQGYYPANKRNSPSSYNYDGGLANNYAFNRVAIGDGTNWITVTLDKTYYIWSHQNVLVDFYGLRP